MHSKLLLTVIAGLFATGAALAQSTPALAATPAATAKAAPAHSADEIAKMQQRADEFFAKIDKDGDGSISREEAAASPGLAKHFDQIDANKDGKLSKDELKASSKAMHEKMAEKFDAQFKAADKDGDGALSKQEAKNGKLKLIVKHFDEIDANKDGKVTREEIHAFMKDQAMQKQATK